MTEAQKISNKLLAAIEGAPNVPAMSQAWSTITRVDSLNELPNGRSGSFYDGRLIVTLATDGSKHVIDAGQFTYRTELVIEKMREAQQR